MAGGEVQIVGLCKRYGDVEAVAGIDLDVPSGEFFSILGPSGCGKTTTLRLVAGFEQPTSGSICLDGVDVADKPPHKRNVNTVFQSYALFPFLSVADNVAFGLRYQRLTKAEKARRTGAALELVQLLGYEKRRPGQLSGGQQQRQWLPALALVLNPAVLLLDEPLGALDAKLRRTLQIELKALQETVGITFLYVTHDQEEALTMSDRLAVMESGKVAQVGTPVEGLRAAGRCLCGRLLGRLQSDGRQRGRPRTRGCVPDHAGDVPPHRGTGVNRLRGPREGGGTTGADRHRALRRIWAEPGAGHGRTPGIPRFVHPGHHSVGPWPDCSGPPAEPGRTATVRTGHSRPGPPAARRAPCSAVVGTGPGGGSAPARGRDALRAAGRLSSVHPTQTDPGLYIPAMLVIASLSTRSCFLAASHPPVGRDSRCRRPRKKAPA